MLKQFSDALLHRWRCLIKACWMPQAWPWLAQAWLLALGCVCGVAGGAACRRSLHCAPSASLRDGLLWWQVLPHVPCPGWLSRVSRIAGMGPGLRVWVQQNTAGAGRRSASPLRRATRRWSRMRSWWRPQLLQHHGGACGAGPQPNTSQRVIDMGCAGQDNALMEPCAQRVAPQAEQTGFIRPHLTPPGAGGASCRVTL